MTALTPAERARRYRDRKRDDSDASRAATDNVTLRHEIVTLKRQINALSQELAEIKEVLVMLRDASRLPPPYPPSPSPLEPSPTPPYNPPPSKLAARSVTKRGSRLPRDFEMSGEWFEAGATAREKAGLPAINLAPEAEGFIDYWHAKPGLAGTKLDWLATWRMWCRNAKGLPTNGYANPGSVPEFRGPREPPPDRGRRTLF